MNKYIFGPIDSHLGAENGVVEFGPASMYNHHDDSNLLHGIIGELTYNDVLNTIILPQISTFQLMEANAIYVPYESRVIKNIEPLEEIFNNYGGIDWFRANGIEMKYIEQSSTKYESMNSLRKVGHCVSNIHTNRSKIIAQESTGQGVFASVDFKTGELVDVSPVLVLPKHEVQEASDKTSVLINFCFSRPGSDLAFLPIGYGAVCNHGGKNANVAIEWHWWGGYYNESVLSISPEELLKSEFAQLYFSYRALRDIKKDEEILIDYGESWEADWNKYLQAKKDFKIFKEAVPLFRRPIDMPASMLPDNWLISCAGANCDEFGEILPDLSLTLRVQSYYPETLEVYWEDDVMPVVTVEPHLNAQSAATINTFVGHTFLFKHKNKVIQVYTATAAKHQRLVISGFTPRDTDEL